MEIALYFALPNSVMDNNKGDVTFHTCARQLWNALPREVRVCDSVGSFKIALKTFLFKKAYF